jgi:hypothetical protein
MIQLNFFRLFCCHTFVSLKKRFLHGIPCSYDTKLCERDRRVSTEIHFVEIPISINFCFRQNLSKLSQVIGISISISAVGTRNQISDKQSKYKFWLLLVKTSMKFRHLNSEIQYKNRISDVEIKIPTPKSNPESKFRCWNRIQNEKPI